MVYFQLFKNFIWKSENNDEPPLMQPPNEDCSADTALKGIFDATDLFLY